MPCHKQEMVSSMCTVAYPVEKSVSSNAMELILIHANQVQLLRGGFGRRKVVAGMLFHSSLGQHVG